MSGMLDRFTVAYDYAAGAILLAKRGAAGGRLVDTRRVDGEVVAALVDCLTDGLEPGEGTAQFIRVTRRDGSRACFDLRLEPISEADFEEAL